MRTLGISCSRAASRARNTRSARRLCAAVSLAALISACDACGGAREPAPAAAPQVEYWSPPDASAEPALVPEAPPPEPAAEQAQVAPPPPVEPGALSYDKGGAQTPKQKPPKQRSSLGMNLGAVTYFADQIVFLDLMKQAPDW